MITRRKFLTSSLAASALANSDGAWAREDKHDLFYWDDHAGFGYAGPQDVEFLDHWRSAGVHYLSINVGYYPVPWSTTLRAIADYTRGIEARSDMVLCPTLAQVHAAKRAGKMALTYDIEGMGSLNGDLAMVELYYRLGVRQMLIAYNLRRIFNIVEKNSLLPFLGMLALLFSWIATRAKRIISKMSGQNFITELVISIFALRLYRFKIA